VNYREAYGLYACNGILFNHESPRRGENFVSRKITMGLAKILYGLQDKIVLGNLDAKRDWGYAKDFVEGMRLMLQQEIPQDYVLATGESFSVRDFVEMAFQECGIDLEWQGSGLYEKGVEKATGRVFIEVSPDFFRPSEVEFLKGDASKAKRELGWQPKTTFKELVSLMVKQDLHRVRTSREEKTPELMLH
jgi:GDPmannose 4,6-dehydratase